MALPRITDITRQTDHEIQNIFDAVELGGSSSGYGAINATSAPYNADNTGVTSAVTAIKAARDAAFAVGARKVYLPAGSYLITQTDITANPKIFDLAGMPNMEIFGDGQGKTKFIMPASMSINTSDTTIFSLAGLRNRLHGITFIGSLTVTGTQNMTVVAIDSQLYSEVYDLEFYNWTAPRNAGVGIVTTYSPYNANIVDTTLGTSISSGAQTVTPASMSGIYVGRLLSIGGSAGGPVVPTSISGCRVWVKADSLGLANNAAVSTWTDFSGNGFDATGSGSTRPIYKTSIVNGLAVVRFDGVDDTLAFTAQTLTNFSIFIVQQTSGDGMLLGHSTLNRQVRIGQGGSGILSNYDGTTNPQSSTLSQPRSSFSIVEYVCNGSTVSWYENGNAKSSGTLTGLTLDNIGEILGSGFISGDIAEIIIYNAALTTLQREQVETYLGDKYAITVASPQYVGAGSPENVEVAAVAASTFTATFTSAHGSVDTVRAFGEGYTRAYVRDLYIHDCPRACGLVVNSQGNHFWNITEVRVGINSNQHALYVQQGDNEFDHIFALGIGGYVIHQYATHNGTNDSSGNRYHDITSIDPGFFHVLIESEYGDTANGSDPLIPSGQGLSRYTTITDCTFINTRHTGSTIVGNIQVTGPTIFTNNTLVRVSAFDSGHSPYTKVANNLLIDCDFSLPENLGGTTNRSNLPGAAMALTGESADPLANEVGGDVFVGPGIGSRKFTVISNTAGVVAVTLAFTGPGDSIYLGNSFTLTSGTDFTLGSNNTSPQLAVTATNLAAAINLFSTVSGNNARAIAVGAVVYVARGRQTVGLTLSTNQSGRISATSASDGLSRIEKALVRYSTVPPAQITSDQNNYNPGALAQILKLSTDATRSLTGLVSGGTYAPPHTEGQEHLIVNVGTHDLVLKHQDSGSTAANRFQCSPPFDISLTPGEGAALLYDAANSYWRVWKRGRAFTVETTASSATIMPRANDDLYTVTGLATAAAFAVPSGTPSEGQKLSIRLHDDGTARGLTWSPIYESSAEFTLPTITIVNKTLYCNFVYDSARNRWHLLSVITLADPVWWTAGGASGFQFAYQALRAASYAASKTDLSGAGNNASNGTSFPTWDATTGWTFDGASWLTSPATCNQKPTTVIARIVLTDLTAMRSIVGAAADAGFQFRVHSSTGILDILKQNTSNVANSSSGISAGVDVVVAVRYDGSGNYVFYINGANVGSGTNNQTFSSGTNTSVIGLGPTGAEFLLGQMLAVVKYDNDIGDTACVAVSNMMAVI